MKKILFTFFIIALIIPTSGFSAQESTLTLSHGFGFPGSKGNIVRIGLENDRVVSSFHLQINFDSKVFTVCDHNTLDCSHCGPCCVCKTPSTYGWGIFDYQARENTGSLGVAGHTEAAVIFPGTNSIADIKFDVADTASLGEYEINFGSTKIATTTGAEIPCVPVNGIFSVVHKGDVNHDSSVDVLDVVLTGLIFLEQLQPTFGELSVADCIDDNEITLEDVFCIVDVILNSESKEQEK